MIYDDINVAMQTSCFLVELFVLRPQVQRHLSKLFDNMAKMKFENDGEGNPSKSGLGMYSKEDEYVPFNEPCDCTGQVYSDNGKHHF